MYKTDFENYINSTEYQTIEIDPIYKELQTLLISALSKEIYLNVEELLHAEILFKLEAGFKEGYFHNIK